MYQLPSSAASPANSYTLNNGNGVAQRNDNPILFPDNATSDYHLCLPLAEFEFLSRLAHETSFEIVMHIAQAYTRSLPPSPFHSTPLQPLSLFLCLRLIHGKPLTRFTRRQERVNAFLLAQAAPQTAKISVERSLREIGYPRSRFRRHAFKVETHGNGKQMHSACAGSCGELVAFGPSLFFLLPPPPPPPPPSTANSRSLFRFDVSPRFEFDFQ